MTNFFFDTSAIAKRYSVEIGTQWVRQLTSPTIGNVIIVCDLTPVEFFAITARQFRDGSISAMNMQILQTGFISHTTIQYLSIGMNDLVLTKARDLVVQHYLRPPDAIQLASAIYALHLFAEPIVFVCADNALLKAAMAEGLQTDNSNNHP